MTEMKLCKDCKHYKRNWIAHLIRRTDKLDKCLNPIVNQNLVSGKIQGKFCDTQRMSFYGCGQEANYFEGR